MSTLRQVGFGMIVLLYAFGLLAFLWACVLFGSPLFGSAGGGGHGNEENKAGQSAAAKRRS
jgi:hypothetical protein